MTINKAQPAQQPVEQLAPEIVTQQAKFFFRPIEVTDAISQNAATGEMSKVKGKDYWKRPPFEMTIPAVSEQGLLDLLTDENKSSVVTKFVTKLCNDATYDKVSLYVRDAIKRGVPLLAETIDTSKVDLFNLAKYAGGIVVNKETWELWKADYIAIMQPLLNKPLEKIVKAASIFIGGLASIADIQDEAKKQELLETLAGYFNQWEESTTPENREKFSIVSEYIAMKFEQIQAPKDEVELDIDSI